MAGSSLKLIVHATDMDMISGHYTMTASIEETLADMTVITSPRETFGVSHEELMQRYDGIPEKWRDTLVAETLKRHHQLRQSIRTSLIDWHGRRFDL
jgi:hypothetical protein